MRSFKYTILFATALSALCSIMLSGVYMLLKSRQDENREREQQISILAAAQIDISSNRDVKTVYAQRVKALVIDQNGEVLTDVDPQSVNEETEGKAVLFVIAEESNSNEVLGYVYPVVGAGLWSKLYGYLAVDKTGKKVLGITFYKQGETPGLGAEIEKPWFTRNFQGKLLYDGDKLIGVKVAKGSAKLDPEFKQKSQSIVDGISGATFTGDGITEMLLKDPMKYEAFFKRQKNNF